MRDVIDIVSHQDQVVLIFHVQVVDDAAVKLLPQGGICQLALAQGGKQSVFFTVHNLLRGKGNIQQVFPQRAGKGLLQQTEVLLDLFLAEQAQRLVDGGNDFLVCIDIASIDMMDGVVVRTNTPADLTEFFLIHSVGSCSFSFIAGWLLYPQS